MAKTKRHRTNVVTIQHMGDFTVAFGVFNNSRYGTIPFCGATKRNPEDPYNKKRGETLALGRAYRTLGRKILAEEYERIHQQFRPIPVTEAVVEKPLKKREKFTKKKATK